MQTRLKNRGFYRDNVLINTHVLDAAVDAGVEYVFAMGTGCGYPKHLEGAVLREEDYLDGVPEKTNDAYAYAKRGMLVHLEALKEHATLDYCYCLPANLYGHTTIFIQTTRTSCGRSSGASSKLLRAGHKRLRSGGTVLHSVIFCIAATVSTR